ncbi:serine hydrolase [Sphingomonas sp. Leaf339]|uniref:serine hydrolase domain-containing protein n=1 Tax=Sphingomonas sp. Leaf339 TaxID=1736343 RepID=UPI0006F4F214|nr:serine hydrolase domain-containing protein [Sphingomonas sp. Leaf339]KQU48276.1 serine hydrolase [Sphingomonas sp. Leaf339]
MKPIFALSLPLLLVAPALTAVDARQAQRQVLRQPAPGAPTSRAATPLPATQAMFASYVRDGKLPGIVGAFGAGNLPPVFVQAGRIAMEPNAPAAGPDSLWRVYSMTKPITGMAAMLLIEEGKIGLDDPVSKYIPAFAKMRVLTSPDTSLDSVPATKPITIRNLLTHTAGLSYSIVAKGPLLKEYERLGLLPAAVNAAAEAQMRQVRPKTLAEFADRVATVPLIAEPGTKWSYSIGLDVMARVIEVASGMPFDRFLQTRFFTPLGMNSTFFAVPAAQAKRLVTNYAFVGDTLTPFDPAATSVYLQQPTFPYGGAGLVTSARDYDRFLSMLANGGTVDGVRVMKEDTVRLGMSNLLPAGVFFDSDGTKQGYGAGGFFNIVDQPGRLPKGSYGWSGAAGTLAWIDPVKHARATVMVNYFPADRYPLATDVGTALRKDAARLGL